jgi:hypothetical protein
MHVFAFDIGQDWSAWDRAIAIELWTHLVAPAIIIVLAVLSLSAYYKRIRQAQERFQFSLRAVFVTISVCAICLSTILSGNGWLLLVLAIGLLITWTALMCRPYPSLVNEEVHVTDRQKINDIVAGVVGSRPWYPNHPATQWVCILHIDDGNAVHACTVSCTTNNGVLIEIWSQEDQGWLLGVYREDGLQDVLGAFADAKRGRS